MAKAPSVESLVADKVNQWLRDYGVQYALQNTEIHQGVDGALRRADSKSGGSGGNYPDVKLVLKDEWHFDYPVMIEYKGYKDKLEKLDKDGHIANIDDKGKPNYKNIKDYAVNGAIHYCHSILQYTEFEHAVAIGVTGYKDDRDDLQLQIGVYYVGKTNYGMGQKIAEYSDLSFLRPENFNDFILKAKGLHLGEEELKKLQEKREQQIEDALTHLNERLYGGKQQEITNINISALARIHLVSASIMANLGVRGDSEEKSVQPLQPEDLKTSQAKDRKDGDEVMRTVADFLEKRGIPEKKQKQIIANLNLTLLQDDYSKPIKNGGGSLIKNAFTAVVEDLGYFYKVGLDIDFTGKLFNVMFRWLAFAGDDQNDVVLTPRYVATMMAKFAKVDKDSYVWDFATGSGGLLVAAMNEMLQDAKDKCDSDDELNQKETNIRQNQILGLEVLPEIYMLAVLNMILMGDGSSNILQGDSLKFDGQYNFGKQENTKFPADVFLLNPPYSAKGNGMIFVEQAISMMDKGRAVVIIQDSAGTGKATSYNKAILKKATLVASVKMPIDIFIGKSNVQTSIYVFDITGKPHPEKHQVRFIDFRDDGYKRSNRKKAKASSNLQDVNHAVGRYAEVVDLVLYGASSLNLLTQAEYIEDVITVKEKSTVEITKKLNDAKAKLKALTKQADEVYLINNTQSKKTKSKAKKDSQSAKREQTADELAQQKLIEQYQAEYEAICTHNAKIGNDWNFDQHKKIDTKPTLADFKKTVADYLSWEVSQILQNQKDDDLGKV